jgi:hypothetical protein
MTTTFLICQYLNICRNISISLVLGLLSMWLKLPQTFLSMLLHKTIVINPLSVLENLSIIHVPGIMHGTTGF